MVIQLNQIPIYEQHWEERQQLRLTQDLKNFNWLLAKLHKTSNPRRNMLKKYKNTTMHKKTGTPNVQPVRAEKKSLPPANDDHRIEAKLQKHNLDNEQKQCKDIIIGQSMPDITDCAIPEQNECSLFTCQVEPLNLIKKNTENKNETDADDTLIKNLHTPVDQPLASQATTENNNTLSVPDENNNSTSNQINWFAMETEVLSKHNLPVATAPEMIRYRFARPPPPANVVLMQQAVNKTPDRVSCGVQTDSSIETEMYNILIKNNINTVAELEDILKKVNDRSTAKEDHATTKDDKKEEEIEKDKLDDDIVFEKEDILSTNKQKPEASLSTEDYNKIVAMSNRNKEVIKFLTDPDVRKSIIREIAMQHIANSDKNDEKTNKDKENQNQKLDAVKEYSVLVSSNDQHDNSNKVGQNISRETGQYVGHSNYDTEDDGLQIVECEEVKSAADSHVAQECQHTPAITANNNQGIGHHGIKETTQSEQEFGASAVIAPSPGLKSMKVKQKRRPYTRRAKPQNIRPVNQEQRPSFHLPDTRAVGRERPLEYFRPAVAALPQQHNQLSQQVSPRFYLQNTGAYGQNPYNANLPNSQTQNTGFVPNGSIECGYPTSYPVNAQNLHANKNIDSNCAIMVNVIQSPNNQLTNSSATIQYCQTTSHDVYYTEKYSTFSSSSHYSNNGVPFQNSHSPNFNGYCEINQNSFMNDSYANNQSNVYGSANTQNDSQGSHRPSSKLKTLTTNTVGGLKSLFGQNVQNAPHGSLGTNIHNGPQGSQRSYLKINDFNSTNQVQVGPRGQNAPTAMVANTTRQVQMWPVPPPATSTESTGVAPYTEVYGTQHFPTSPKCANTMPEELWRTR